MKITYFFRKQSPSFHSIEELFFNIQTHLSKNIEYKNYFARYHTGFIGRVKNIFNVRKNQNEINHITGDINYISYLMKKSKTILTIHDIGSILKGNKIKIAILKLFWFTIPAKRVKYITVISEFTKKQVLENINIKPEKIIVIPNCISTKLKYIHRTFNVRSLIILQIGTKENKNLPRIVQAIKNIKCKLIIIGKLSDEQKQLLKINKIHYENYFNLEYSEIIKWYQKADILTFASTYEGFGVPIIEANACGTCVITSNLSPMKEVAENSALLVNPYETNEIKNAIQEIINSQKLRENLIKNGLENAKKYHSVNIAKKYAKLYEKIKS